MRKEIGKKEEAVKSLHKSLKEYAKTDEDLKGIKLDFL